MRELLAAAAATLAVVTAVPAGAVTFNLIDTGGAAAGTQARAGFDAAAAYWSSVLTNTVTVNLNIGFQSLSPGTLAQTSSTSSIVTTGTVYQALQLGQTSALDHTAVSNLQPLTSGAVTMTVNQYANTSTHSGYTDGATRIDNDGSNNNRYLDVNTATLKALGITSDTFGNAIAPGASDGSITFSSNYNFDFNPSNGVDASAYDFIGVAIHEFGHALGFTSGVDSYDYYTGTAPGAGSIQSLETYAVGSVLDLYRYSAAGTLDWSTSAAAKYFSIDGGQTNLFGDSNFALGTYNGDGYQASHWQESAAGLPQIGVMDPTSGLGQMQDVTAGDLAAFDAMGYTLSFDVLDNSGYRQSTGAIYASQAAAAAVPEPATWAELLLGFGMVGGALRRRAARPRALRSKPAPRPAV